MNKKATAQKLCATAMLIAIGVVIPMFSPVKIVIPPASFTLASHVAIFIAMFISPSVAGAVAAGTTMGFFLGGFPIVIVLRAATHLVFSVLGAVYLQKHPDLSPINMRFFSLAIGAVHAVCEVLIVTAFYFGGNMGEVYYESGFFRSVALLVGLGSVIHSMVDFEISLLVVKVLQKQKSFSIISHGA